MEPGYYDANEIGSKEFTLTMGKYMDHTLKHLHRTERSLRDRGVPRWQWIYALVNDSEDHHGNFFFTRDDLDDAMESTWDAEVVFYHFDPSRAFVAYAVRGTNKKEVVDVIDIDEGDRDAWDALEYEMARRRPN